MRYLKGIFLFQVPIQILSWPIQTSLPPGRGQNYHEIRLVLDRIFYQHVDVSALLGARTRLSPRIYVWADTSGSPGQGIYLGDYGSRIPSRVTPQTKSSVSNV